MKTEGLRTLTTTWKYGLGGRLTRKTAPDGVIIHSYAPAGNELITGVKTSDETLVTRTKKEYNLRGEIISETDTLGAVTKYTYDPNGLVATLKTATEQAKMAWIALFYCYFYAHELYEFNKMKNGMGNRKAQEAAKIYYNAVEFNFYHPEVIKQNLELFSRV